MLALIVTIAEQVKHQASDRVRRVARVAEQIVERVEALEVDVGSESGQQILERLAGYVEAVHRVGERDEHRMARRAGICQIELTLPLVEHRAVVMLIGKVVGHPRIRVNRVHVGTHLARHQPRRDRKIFVVRLRQPRAELVGTGDVERSRRDRRVRHRIRCVRRCPALHAGPRSCHRVRLLPFVRR